MIQITLMDRYIGRQLLDNLLLGVVIFTLIAFFSETLLKLMQEVQKYGLPLDSVINIIGLQLPRSIALVIPASAFLAVLMVYSQMNSQLELIALRMNGVSLWRLMAPAIVLGVFCSIFGYVLNDYVVPWCSLKTEVLKHQAIHQSSLPSEGGSFLYQTFDDNHRLKQLVFINRYKKQQLGDNTIIDLTKTGFMQIFQSRSGIWDKTTGWTLKNVNAYLVADNKNQSSAGHLESLKLNALFSGKQNKNKHLNSLKDYEEGVTARSDIQNFATLWHVIENRRVLGKSVSKTTYLRLWDKLTWPFSCLVMILSAAPLAIQSPRRGNGQGFVYAIVLLFGFYMLYNVCQSFARVSALNSLLPLPLYLATVAWFPLFVMAGLGVFLIQKKTKQL
ncbi:MAG: LptF/LptG family permease [Cyanobacteria bacterium P01_H01_bin.74]